MGIWIRSQDSEILAECNALIASPSENNGFYIYADSKGEKVYLGGYSTKEKALKVLDMIEEWINDLEFSRNVKSCRCKFVYQMPDEEVLGE